MSGVVVVGIQWGDEGKGKIIDVLSSEADLVVRSQGGDNAGHTVIVEGEEFKFHLIPSGILSLNASCYITGGTVLNPETLIKEIEQIEKSGIPLKKRLKISAFAHLILPYHKELDGLYEDRKGEDSIGTTRKGVGPCYADKANRLGIQIGDLLDFTAFSKRLRQVVSLKNLELINIFNKPPVQFQEYARKLAPYITDSAEREIADSLKSGKKVLLEGAHGSYLDLTFGTYPYVTSSSTIAAGVVAGAGVGPSQINHVLGVVKAYTTRVGEGPLPTVLQEEEAELFVHAKEVGTTTGRMRRIGWFDAPLVLSALRLNGAHSIALTKLDVLGSLAVIKICIGYELDGNRIDMPPVRSANWERIIPVYEELPGWQQEIKDITSYEQLPLEAKNYLKRIETLCECPISLISYGPEREKILYLNSIF
jgi:adenylosuccinate synthase